MALFSTLFIWVAFFLPIALLLLRRKTGNNRDHRQLPPSPPKLPLLGNLHQIGAVPHNTFWQLSKKYGPVLLLRLGRIPLLVVSSAEAAKDVLKIHDLACCSRPLLAGSRRLTYNFLDLGFSPYTPYWRERRKIAVLELFSVKQVQSFRFIREEEVASMMEMVSKSAASGAPVDLGERIFSLTGSIIFRVSFGTSYHGSEFDHQKRLQQLMHEAHSVLGGFTTNEYIPYLGWIWDRITGLHAKVEKVFQDMDTFFQNVIDDHLKPERTDQHRDIIDVLLETERNRPDKDFSADRIKAVLMNIFLGGIDTSSLTALWAMAELAKTPRLMKKAQDEIRNYVGNKGRVAEESLEKLPYLKMVVKETLRLHPPASLLLPRETMSPCKISGYDIEPKTIIQVNVWAIARDPQYWKNPEEFSPERFTDSSLDYKGQNFEYLPFGSGRRGCPGIYMGVTTTELLLANLLYCFDWKLPDGMKEEDIDMKEGIGFSATVAKKTPLLLVPVNYLQ